MSEFEIKDSGDRQQFESGMVRDTAEGKTDFTSVRYGPMYRRWAEHTTKGRSKYPDPFPGVPNWTLAEGVEEFLRARESMLRHQEAYLAGEMDEDHAAGVFFNINLMEYVREYVEAMGGEIPFTFERRFVPEDEPIPWDELIAELDGLDINETEQTPETQRSAAQDVVLETLDEAKPWHIIREERPTMPAVLAEPPLRQSETPREFQFGVGDQVLIRTGDPVDFDGMTGTVIRRDNDGDSYHVRLYGGQETIFDPHELELIQSCNGNCLDCVCDGDGVQGTA